MYHSEAGKLTKLSLINHTVINILGAPGAVHPGEIPVTGASSRKRPVFMSSFNHLLLSFPSLSISLFVSLSPRCLVFAKLVASVVGPVGSARRRVNLIRALDDTIDFQSAMSVAA